MWTSRRRILYRIFGLVFMSILLVAIGMVSVPYLQNNKDVIRELRIIQKVIRQKDSIIVQRTGMLKVLQEVIESKDSVIWQQKEVIDDFENKYDSLSYLMRYLERSDLRERYRSEDQ